MGSIRSHVRSNVVGYLALFVALGGTAYAAVELGKNDVRSKHIGKGQVKKADIARNAVNSPKVADGSLRRKDFAAGQLPAGPQGERGPEGPTGTAQAFGRVIPDAVDSCVSSCTVDRSKGISQVIRANEGDYCVRVPGVSATQVPAVVSVDWDSTATTFRGNAEAMIRSASFVGCPPDDFVVQTTLQDPTDVRNAADTGPQSVAGNAIDSDLVGFTIVIP